MGSFLVDDFDGVVLAVGAADAPPHHREASLADLLL